MNRSWLPRSLRARLTLWHIAAMVLVLVVYAAAVFSLVRRNGSQALDDRLRSDFRWAAEMAEQRPDGMLTWFDGDARDENNPWLQVWSEDGQALFRTAVATRLPVPASDRLARDPRRSDCIGADRHGAVQGLERPRDDCRQARRPSGRRVGRGHATGAP